MTRFWLSRIAMLIAFMTAMAGLTWALWRFSAATHWLAPVALWGIVVAALWLRDRVRGPGDLAQPRARRSRPCESPPR